MTSSGCGMAAWPQLPCSPRSVDLEPRRAGISPLCPLFRPSVKVICLGRGQQSLVCFVLVAPAWCSVVYFSSVCVALPVFEFRIASQHTSPSRPTINLIADCRATGLCVTVCTVCCVHAIQQAVFRGNALTHPPWGINPSSPFPVIHRLLVRHFHSTCCPRPALSLLRALECPGSSPRPVVVLVLPLSSPPARPCTVHCSLYRHFLHVRLYQATWSIGTGTSPNVVPGLIGCNRGELAQGCNELLLLPLFASLAP